MNKHTRDELKILQALPLQLKIEKTKNRIIEWVDMYGLDGVYISFSGGKDSTVLLDIARKLYPTIKAMFVNTGLEYPEIVQFVKTFDNVDIIRPKMGFKEVILKYGYPFISKEVSRNLNYAKRYLKGEGITNEYYIARTQGRLDKNKVIHKEVLPRHLQSPFCHTKYAPLLESEFYFHATCCYVMKKAPAHKYQKETGRATITAQMAGESLLRTSQWLKNGCNGFNLKTPMSNPMSFWTEQDVLKYIYDSKLPIASVYGEVIPKYGQYTILEPQQFKTTGCKRTGCMFCGYGCQQEKKGEGRFLRLKETHPKIYDYIMRPDGLNYKAVIDDINARIGTNIEY